MAQRLLHMQASYEVASNRNLLSRVRVQKACFTDRPAEVRRETIRPLAGKCAPVDAVRGTGFGEELGVRGHPGPYRLRPRSAASEVEMSHRNRIVFAGIALVAALALAMPAPARAVGFLGGAYPMAGALERAWGWLTRLVVPEAAPSPRLRARWEKEGSAINPDGRTSPSTPPTAMAVELPDRGR